MPFADLGLSEELLRSVTDAGYTEPTPIQAAAQKMGPRKHCAVSRG